MECQEADDVAGASRSTIRPGQVRDVVVPRSVRWAMAPLDGHAPASGADHHATCWCGSPADLPRLEWTGSA
jgi:hypothetical protein